MANVTLTQLQREILQYAKDNSFKVSITDFINAGRSNIEEYVIDALKDLKKKRIVAMAPDIRKDFIGVTNYGWKIMGWEK